MKSFSVTFSRSLRMLALVALLAVIVPQAAPARVTYGNAQTNNNARDQDGCEVVELYPGYPGFRGNITGLMAHWGGTGDYECLDTLERIDRDFSKSREDRLNRKAARELGISGTFEDWTWENWLTIEATRGLPSSCYTCLMFDESSSPINPDYAPDPSDSRILLGFFGSNETAQFILHDLDLRADSSLLYLQDDYMLRAAVPFFTGNFYLNAPETLEVMYDIVEGLFEPGAPYLDSQKCREIALEHGGYVPTSRAMPASDQIFIMTAAYYTASTQLIFPADFIREVEVFADEWLRSGSRLSLAEYMRRELDL